MGAGPKKRACVNLETGNTNRVSGISLKPASVSSSLPPPSLSAPPAESGLRERILGAARRHFLAEGFRAVTMDDLARGMGMSKKTFYRCFPGKTALLEAVIMHKFEEVAVDLASVTERADLAFPARLELMLMALQRHLGELQPAFLRDLGRDAPELFLLARRRRAELINRHFGRLLKEGREAGMVRRDIPVRVILEILLGSVETIIHPAKLEELNLTPKGGLSVIVRILLEGVLTAPG